MSNVKQNTITDADVLKLMKAATKSMTTMRTKVQTALVAMVQHAHEHGDKTLIINHGPKFINDLRGVNGQAIVEYLTKFGGVQVKGKGFVANPKNKADLMGAKATMWFDLKVQNAWGGFNLETELAKLLAKADKAKDKAIKEGLDPVKVVNINSGLLSAVRTAIAENKVAQKSDNVETATENAAKDVLAA